MKNKKEILVSVEIIKEWIDRLEDNEMDFNRRIYVIEDMEKLIKEKE